MSNLWRQSISGRSLGPISQAPEPSTTGRSAVAQDLRPVLEGNETALVPERDLTLGLPPHTAAVANRATIGCADPQDTATGQEGQTAPVRSCWKCGSERNVSVISLLCDRCRLKPRLIGAYVIGAKQDRERNLKMNLRHG